MTARSDDSGSAGAAGPDANAQTIAGYEGCALDYAQSTAESPDEDRDGGLSELLAALEPGSQLLEIGSGPGWDADRLEARGMAVRRTDATEAFIRFQQARGKRAERLDMLRDPLGGPYDAVLALYVLQHVGREALPPLLQAIAASLREGGAFLFSIREGFGEIVEQGTEGGRYFIALWRVPELVEMLRPLRLTLAWSSAFDGSDGRRWLMLLVRKVPQDEAIG
jgi:2-polyprenyl-3-methyl-5-hydroxy-6-metoxy-1,4-benzoquinol methylase